MIEHNIHYRGVSLSDSQAKSNKLAITNMQKQLNIRTWVVNNQNTHGGNVGASLWSTRLFTISWTIFGATKADLQVGQQKLSEILRLDGFHTLRWDDDGWNTFKTQAQVYRMPRFSSSVNTNIITFTFELISETAEYISLNSTTISGGVGLMWGTTLWTTLWVELSWLVWAVNITNSWDFRALVDININWAVTNPSIRNLTTNKYYKLNRATTKLNYKNTSYPITVTDDSENVRANRSTWSTSVVLEPWVNRLVLLSDNYNIDNNITLSIVYNNTYIKS